MVDETIRNPLAQFFKWKMAVVLKSQDDWTQWNCDESYDRTLFIGIHDDETPAYAALYLIYKGDVQPAAGNAVLADLLALDKKVTQALAELQSLIDTVNQTTLDMQTLKAEVQEILNEIEDRVEEMAEQVERARVWAEGTDSEVTPQGGVHSAKGWAGIAKQAADLATGAAFPTLAEGDQGKALVVNDSCDGYELTTISASAADFSTNRIVHTANEEQNFQDKSFADGRLVWLSSGIRGWFPNGHRSAPVNDADYSKLTLVPYMVDTSTVLYNTSTEQHVQGISAGQQPLRKYEGEGLMVFCMGYGGGDSNELHLIGFKYPSEITSGSWMDYTPSGQYHCRFDFNRGLAKYTADGGQTWGSASLPVGICNLSWRGYYFMPSGSLVTTQWFYNQYGTWGKYWVVAPFEARIAAGFMSPTAGGVNSIAKAQEVKFMSDSYYIYIDEGNSGFYGLDKKLLWRVNAQAALGVTFDTASRVAYDGLINKIRTSGAAHVAPSIVIGMCPSETWWKMMNDTYSTPSFPQGFYPYFGVPPTFLANFEPTDVLPTEVVRTFTQGTESSEYNGRGALANATSGSMFMTCDSGNSDALKVWKVKASVYALDPMTSGTDWQNECDDISPASLKGQNTYSGRQNYNGYVNFYNTAYVQSTGAMNAMSAKYFLVPNPSLDESNARHVLEAVNVGTMEENLQGLEPANSSTDLNPDRMTWDMWMENDPNNPVLNTSTGIVTGTTDDHFIKHAWRVEDMGLTDTSSMDFTFKFKAQHFDHNQVLMSITDYVDEGFESLSLNAGGYGINGSRIGPDSQISWTGWHWVRVIISGGTAKIYSIPEKDTSYTLGTLPELDPESPANDWVVSESTAHIVACDSGYIQIGKDVLSGNALDKDIDLKNSRIIIGGKTFWDGSQVSSSNTVTEGIHQQSALRTTSTVAPLFIRRFECDGHVFLEVDGTVSAIVATDSSVSIPLRTYGVKGTLYSVQATPQGSGAVTVNFSTTTPADLSSGKLTLTTSLAAGETLRVSFHLLVMQS